MARAVREATAQIVMTWFPERKLLHTAEMAQPLGPNNPNNQDFQALGQLSPISVARSGHQLFVLN
jgi:hypothetical protein